MAVQFAVLASGSKGNATYLAGAGPGILIDIGLSGKALGTRLERVGAGWSKVGAVLLTHTHSDHIDSGAMAEMARHKVILHCHQAHRPLLAGRPGFEELLQQSLVRDYDDAPFLTATGARVEPIAMSHDGPTYGFRIELNAGIKRRPVSIGYVADTGTWSEAMVDRLHGVDLLAVEFNHDVELERLSPRPEILKKRNLGDRGHLSNQQGAGLVACLLARSQGQSPREIVLLHLSSDCNSPELALEAAAAVCTGQRIHAAKQDHPHPILTLQPGPRRALGQSPQAPRSQRHRPREHFQSSLFPHHPTLDSATVPIS